jgi:toxin ParE1/3/4
VKPILVHSEAHAELDEAIAHYEQQQKGLGLDLRDEVERIIKRIQRSPGSGPPYKQTAFRHSNLHRFPYVVYYRELDDVIWIVAVAHGRRRPGYWKKRKLGNGE